MRRSGSGRPAFNQRTRQHMLETFSPTGLHVLVVDDDPLCLFVLEKMLKECSYRVTTCNEVNRALEILRENDDEFDLVISDVYLPQEDGFRLLEVIGLELDLPVIMISSNADVKVVMKGILHGACDYLIKPVRIEELRNIWQHVMRRRAGHAILRPEMNIDQPDDSEVREEGYRKRKDVLEIPDDRTEDINSSPKRARVNWSQQLHQQFVSAVNQLGIDSKLFISQERLDAFKHHYWHTYVYTHLHTCKNMFIYASSLPVLIGVLKTRLGAFQMLNDKEIAMSGIG